MTDFKPVSPGEAKDLAGHFSISLALTGEEREAVTRMAHTIIAVDEALDEALDAVLELGRTATQEAEWYLDTDSERAAKRLLDAIMIISKALGVEK